MEFKYVLPQLKPGESPNIQKPKGAKIACFVEADGGVELIGNSAGLAYLAKHLVAMSMIKGTGGMHIHLNAECQDLDEGSSEVTIGNLDFGDFNRG